MVMSGRLTGRPDMTINVYVDIKQQYNTTDRPDITIDVYRGRKTTTHHSNAWAEGKEIQATDILFVEQANYITTNRFSSDYL